MWFFRSPEIVFGEDALDHIMFLTGQRAFIVTDATMIKLGFVETVRDKLRAANIESSVFSEVRAEPDLPLIRRGAVAMAEYQPDWVVALGGGSPLDAAKAMWILYERPDLDLFAVNPFEPLHLRQKAKLLAISATSGTGSEATWGLVITDPEDQRKVGIGSPENLPDIAIVDPALTVTMPPRLTADTGMDALTHAIEGYTSTWCNDFSDGLCLKAADLIFEYLPRAVEDGSDLAVREKMHNAAAIAGLGFINSMCSLAHALGHSLGAKYKLPHGRVVGMFLPYTIQFNALGSEATTRYQEVARFLGLPADSPAQGADSLVEAIHALAEMIEQPHAIKEMIDISAAQFEANLPELVEHAEQDTQIITTPRAPSSDDVARLFRYAFDGRDVDW